MFTIDQIAAAHAKVKSGADFPAYIQDLLRLGVTGYSTYVSDGHTVYSGKGNYQISSGPKYAVLNIAAATDQVKFLADLKTHQQGGSDYPAFCKQAADAGVEKWSVAMDEMTCTYSSRAGSIMLVESIPAAAL